MSLHVPPASCSPAVHVNQAAGDTRKCSMLRQLWLDEPVAVMTRDSEQEPSTHWPIHLRIPGSPVAAQQVPPVPCSQDRTDAHKGSSICRRQQQHKGPESHNSVMSKSAAGSRWWTDEGRAGPARRRPGWGFWPQRTGVCSSSVTMECKQERRGQ